MSVIKIHDKPDDQLISTDLFKYAHWPFEKFNPVQSAIYDYISQDINIGIAATTAAGKTVCAEMFLSDEVRRRGGKGIYIGPLKALANEKLQDWTDPKHHFNDLKVSVCTGDYRVTTSRIKELDAANLIVMTPEMLASRCRNVKSERSSFLKEVGTIALDESHLLTVPSRGDHIEVALMKMTEINPNVRIVLLSATMPNVDEICGWVHKLNKKETILIESKYRPCPLKIHYIPYYDGVTTYQEKEEQKVATAIRILQKYSQYKFLFFVHSKDTGKLLVQCLNDYGIETEFHNADLGAKKRSKIEKEFKENPDCKVLVATSTISWGCNLPSRCVVILGIHRGTSIVENYDIGQMCGRAGRPKYDPRGDAFILIPESRKHESILRLQRPTQIVSQLVSDINDHPKTLAFHVVSEIHHGNIRTREEFHQWFRRSLMHYQNPKFNEMILDSLLDLLVRNKVIIVEDDVFKTTAVGKIASMFYFSPFDVADLRRNFAALFDKGYENNDFAIAMALGNIDSNRMDVVSKNTRMEMEKFQKKVEFLYGKTMTDGAIKNGCGYYNLMHGKHNEAMSSTQAILRYDLERTIEVVNAIDSMSMKWGKKQYFKKIRDRLTYGVPENLLELCQLKNVGQTRAERLQKSGIEDLHNLINVDITKLADIMQVKPDAAKKIQEEAKLIKIKKHLLG